MSRLGKNLTAQGTCFPDLVSVVSFFLKILNSRLNEECQCCLLGHISDFFYFIYTLVFLIELNISPWLPDTFLKEVSESPSFHGL